VLQLPTIAPISVVNPQYRWTEEERLGGYCTFDMTFVEYGVPTTIPLTSSRDQMIAYSNLMKDRIQQVMTGLEAQLAATAASTPRLLP
jgi:hypothetical protein